MIYGTLYNAGRMLELTQKWETKKESGKVLAKQDRELTAEERELERFREEVKTQQESSKYNAIYTKLQCGKELTSEEEKALREKNPQAYMEYKADQIERKAYEEKLKKCKTKDEAERLHVNTMYGKLSRLSSVLNNPNIPKGAKLAQARRILGDVTKTVEIYHKFTKSTEYSDLPRERDILEAERAEREKREAELKISQEAESADAAKLEDAAETEETAPMPEATETTEVKSEIKSEIKAEAKPDHKHEDIDVTKIDIAEIEKKVFEEIFELEEKHFGKPKKARRINVRA